MAKSNSSSKKSAAKKNNSKIGKALKPKTRTARKSETRTAPRSETRTARRPETRTVRSSKTRTIRTRNVSSGFANDLPKDFPDDFLKSVQSESDFAQAQKIQFDALSSIKREPAQKSKISEDSVSRAFLFIFIAALSFVIGTGVGNKTNQSIIDSAIDKLIESAPDDLNRDALERAAIEGAVKASGDEWANYFPQSSLERLNEVTSSSLTGIGISITEARSGAIGVSDVIEDSAAARKGIEVGDQILSVNGVDVQGASATAVAALLRGSVGKEVDISIRRGTKLVEFTLIAEKVDLRTVESSQIDSKIAYISISNFAIGTAGEVRAALAKLDSSKGVILDLRDNPGGIIEEAVRVSEQFIGRGVIVSYKVNGNERIFAATNSKPNPAPVVILINKSTTSAAELLAAAFQDRNRGVVIGERSYGKGSVQEFVTLKDGSKLELTVALYLTPSGRTIEGVGVTPDLVVKESDLATKALQILGGLAELATKPAK